MVKCFNHTSWMAVVIPTDRPKSVRNRCTCELDIFGGVCVLSLGCFEFTVGIAAFVIRLSQMSSFFSLQHIEIVFDTLDVESTENCKWDSVTVYEGYSSNGQVLGRFCGQTVPPPLNSGGGAVYIVFETDRFVQGKGFNLTYSAKDTTSPRTYFVHLWNNSQVLVKHVRNYLMIHF